MPISVNPITHVISVPQSYLSPVSTGLYALDTNQFRVDLALWSATEEGRAEPFPYDHNTEYTVAGETYARKIELINGYSWQLEDTGSFYSVKLIGSNNNLFDVQNGVFIPHGNVGLIPSNSAGLQIVTTGSGVTAQDKVDIINGVFSRIIENGETFEEALRLIRAEAAGSIEVAGTTHNIKSADGLTDRITATADQTGRTVTATNGA